MKNWLTAYKPRLVRHLLLWIVMWLFVRYVSVGVYVHDTNQVLNWLSVITYGQTMALFYLLGYLLLPHYLYRFRLAPFVGLFLLVCYAVYLTDYGASYYLHQISTDSSHRLYLHTQEGWNLIHSVGLLGCFTNPEVAFLTVGNNLFYVVPLLAAKVIKDVVTHRTQTLLIERDAVDMERQNLALERENLTLELDLLKAQVNPHFLFNALNSIYARVVDANEPAAELVLRLAELMRYNLYEADVAMIALTDEIAYIENYLNLERMRHASLVDVLFTADDDFSGYQIAPLVLIAFVENAFKHGLGGSSTAYVLVDIQVEEGTFYFTVQNSLPPTKRIASVKKSGGVGLVNIKKRLALLYPDRHQLEISQTPTSYTTTLQLQLDPLN